MLIHKHCVIYSFVLQAYVVYLEAYACLFRDLYVGGDLPPNSLGVPLKDGGFLSPETTYAPHPPIPNVATLVCP